MIHIKYVHEFGFDPTCFRFLDFHSIHLICYDLHPQAWIICNTSSVTYQVDASHHPIHRLIIL